jgi:hypothetical protein
MLQGSQFLGVHSRNFQRILLELYLSPGNSGVTLKSYLCPSTSKNAAAYEKKTQQIMMMNFGSISDTEIKEIRIRLRAFGHH